VHPYAWPAESDAYALVPALSLAYYLVVRRLPVERWRIVCFALAMLLLVAVFATPVETLSLNYLLTAHFLQNVTVAEWAPALLVLSLPPQLARRVHVPMIPALVLWLGTYFVWHAPAAYDFALAIRTRPYTSSTRRTSLRARRSGGRSSTGVRTRA
jgi:Predicted membrane protein